MKHRRSSTPCATSLRGFTLIELLVVLAIIGLLAAILFPAFKSAQERGYQANCAANLKQIYQAVQLYRQDEKAYPSSLAFLLPNDFSLDGGDNTNGTGYFRGGRDALVCADDDTDSTTPRSSYGDISWSGAPSTSADMNRYLWNYWGYRATDGTTCVAGTTDVHECAGTAVMDPSTDIATAFPSCTGTNPCPEALTPTAAYDAKKNPIKYSMSNRYAPTSTIITHCVYHRMPTASGKLSNPFEVYTDTTNGAGARDIILRLDGTARVLDVSAFASNSHWQTQNW